jgi:hypothetical protein
MTMKKLTTVFAVLAVSAAFAVSGCSKKKDDAAADQPAAKTTDDKMAPKADDKAMAPKADDKMAAPAGDKAAAPAPAAAAGDLPAECNDYKATIEKLAACDKLPQATRDALKQSYESVSAAWAQVPADQKAALGTGCKQAADAVKQSAAAVCGW